MIVKIFSVFDKKARSFCTPFYMPNVETAVRAFHQAANDKSIDVGRYPADFDLFMLGTFNDETGVTESPLGNHEHVVSALELVISE